MKKYKRKIVLICFMSVFLIVTSTMTFSMFISSTEGEVDQEIASFVFDAQKTNHLELSLVDLKPGDSEEYTFSVKNNKSELISHVTIAYKISIQTYHFMPLELKLYKVIEDEEQLIMTCDETYSRDPLNNLVCNTETQEMVYDKTVTDQYKLTVTFPKEYSSVDYADLVDYIAVDIKSWQKLS